MPTSDQMPPSPEDCTSAADYVAAMTAEMANIARRHGFAALGYLLEMAQLEAQNLAEQNERAPPN